MYKRMTNNTEIKKEKIYKQGKCPKDREANGWMIRRWTLFKQTGKGGGTGTEKEKGWTRGIRLNEMEAGSRGEKGAVHDRQKRDGGGSFISYKRNGDSVSGGVGTMVLHRHRSQPNVGYRKREGIIPIG